MAVRQKKSNLDFIRTGIRKIKCDKSRLQILTKWVTKCGRNHKVRQDYQV